MTPRFRTDNGAPLPTLWRFPMPPREGDVLILSLHDAAEGPREYDLQEFSPSRGTGLFVGTYADLPTGLFAASLWISCKGDPEQFRPPVGPLDPQTRRLQTRFGLPAETAETIARLAFGGRNDG